MGIYGNGSVFGLRIYLNNFNDGREFSNILFEKKYHEIMSYEQMKEAYLFYTEFDNKNELRFQYYTECSSTYDEGIYLHWYPMSLNLFLEKFGICEKECLGK